MEPDTDSRELAAPTNAVAGAVDLAPVGQRIELIDVLRGFALFGILLINVPAFGAPIYLMMHYGEWFPGTADHVAEITTRFLAQGKFYTLFAMLFGLGFAIQFGRAEARGANSARFLRRRMGGLLLIGLAHAFLFWYGDILTVYAITGFLLVFFRRLSNRALTIWTVSLLLAPLVLTGGFTLLFEIASRFPAAATEIETAMAEQAIQIDEAAAVARQVYASGSVGQILWQNVLQNKMMYQFIWMGIPGFLGLFLIGFQAGRRGIFERIDAMLPRIRQWYVPLLILGLAGNVLLTVGSEYSDPMVPSLVGFAAQFGATFGTLALSLFYVATLTLLFQRPAWRRPLGLLAAVGRMALTNYLTHTLVFTTVFYSWGFGLYGRVGPAQCVLLAVAIYALQIPLSIWWLSRFRYGPMEWVWRTLTYGKLQPMRKAVRTAGAVS